MAEEKKNGAVATVEPRRISLFEQMEREFEEMRRWMFDVFRRPMGPSYRRALLTEAETAWAPTADAYVADGALVVEAELPGVQREDITITVADGILTVAGQRKAEKEVKEARYYASERFTGAFTRSFAIPEGIDTATIAAEFKEGVLKVRVPLPAEAKSEPVRIAVKE
jgi:HSP20 family protein